MKALRFYDKGDIRLDEVPEPTLQPGRAIVEVEWCGICGSDLHEYLAGPTETYPKPGTVHPLTGENRPTTMGHEVCGRIWSVNVDSKFKPGQPVMVDPRLCCMKCQPCQDGIDHGCNKLGFLGFSGVSGGYSNFMLVEEQCLHKLPDNVPIELAAMIEPLVVVHHAIKQAGEQDLTRKNVLVLGGGPVGIAMSLALRAYNTKQIIVSEPTVTRQNQLSEYAHVVLNPKEDNIGDRCRALTQGHGVDLVFDCAGVQPAMDSGFDAIRLRGTYVNIAVWETQVVLPLAPFMMKDITLRPSVVYNHNDFAEVMKFMTEGRFEGYGKMVTARISLEDVIEKGFKELIQNKDSHIKILVTPKKGLLVE